MCSLSGSLLTFTWCAYFQERCIHFCEDVVIFGVTFKRHRHFQKRFSHFQKRSGHFQKLYMYLPKNLSLSRGKKGTSIILLTFRRVIDTFRRYIET